MELFQYTNTNNPTRSLRTLRVSKASNSDSLVFKIFKENQEHPNTIFIEKENVIELIIHLEEYLLKEL